MILRIKQITFDRTVRIWFILYFICAILGTLSINRLPLLIGSRNPLYLFFWFGMMIIGCLKALQVKLVVDAEYKAVEVVETRRGVNLYLRNYLKPIYVPIQWLEITQSAEKNEFILNYDKAIQFKYGRSLLLKGGQITLTEKYFSFQDMSNLDRIIDLLKKNPNADINAEDIAPSVEEVIPDKWRTAKVFPWIALGVSLPTIIGTAIFSDDVLSPSPYTLQMNASLHTPDYHKIYNYSKNMTISTKYFKFKILNAYKVKKYGSPEDYIILHIRTKAAADYQDLEASNFMSFENWTMKAEKDGQQFDEAQDNQSFAIKSHGKEKAIINVLREGQTEGGIGNSQTFNVILAKTDGITDVVYAGFDASLGRTKGQDTSFVLKIRPSDLEKIS